jgi:hypothetical protein
MPSKIEREAERYRTKLNRTLEDGTVTKKEADALIKDAKNGHFSQVEAHYLSGFVDRSPGRFDPAAREKLVAFVATEMAAYARIAGDTGLKRTPTQPKLTEDSEKSGRVAWKPVEGKLTVDGFGADDPLQGQVGDCYFISALAAVAKSRPELLAKAVTTNRDGTYTVRFFERKNGEAKPTPVSVTIDGSFASRGSTLEYASARETKELWPLIFEKAYATWKGGFGAIEGGMSATALEALTGAKPGFFPVTTESKPEAVAAQLERALSNGGAVVALSKPWEPSVRGVVADHAYTVLGVEQRDGETFVKLRNPWGEREPGHDGRDDGIFELPVSKFLGAFATVEYAQP